MCTSDRKHCSTICLHSPTLCNYPFALSHIPHSLCLSFSLFLSFSFYRSTVFSRAKLRIVTIPSIPWRFRSNDSTFETIALKFSGQIREPRRSPAASKLALLLKLELTTFIASGRFRPRCFALLIRRRFLVELSNRHSVIPIVYFIPWKTLVGILFAWIISKFYQEQTLRFFFTQFNGSRV